MEPLAIADGIVLGVTISMLALIMLGYFFQFDFFQFDRGLKENLELVSGTFSLYALLVSIPILITRFENLEVFDVLFYPFIFLSNYFGVRKGISEKESDA